MFEFAESILKGEKEVLSGKKESLNEELKEIKEKIAMIHNYQDNRTLSVIGGICTAVAVGFSINFGIIAYTMYLEDTERIAIELFALMSAGAGICTLAEGRFTAHAIRNLIKLRKEGAKDYYKNKNSILGKEKELEKTINTCDQVMADINTELGHIHFFNTNHQEPLYRATTVDEYEAFMKIKANAILDSYLNERIEYDNIHFDASLQKTEGKILIKK